MKNRKRKITLSNATPDLIIVRPYLKVRINTRHGLYFARLLIRGMNGCLVIYKKWLSLDEPPTMKREERERVYTVNIPPEHVLHTLQFTLGINAKLYVENLN